MRGSGRFVVWKRMVVGRVNVLFVAADKKRRPGVRARLRSENRPEKIEGSAASKNN